MLHQYFKSHCITNNRWFVYLETRFYSFVPTSYCASWHHCLATIFNVVGSVIDRYSEVPQSYKFSSSYQHTLHDYICYLFIKQTFQNITFYSLDTYFALSKPIHRNPPHITSLSISILFFIFCLFVDVVFGVRLQC